MKKRKDYSVVLILIMLMIALIIASCSQKYEYLYKYKGRSLEGLGVTQVFYSEEGIYMYGDTVWVNLSTNRIDNKDSVAMAFIITGYERGGTHVFTSYK